jgi:hypothetical protein
MLAVVRPAPDGARRVDAGAEPERQDRVDAVEAGCAAVAVADHAQGASFVLGEVGNLLGRDPDLEAAPGALGDRGQVASAMRRTTS